MTKKGKKLILIITMASLFVGAIFIFGSFHIVLQHQGQQGSSRLLLKNWPALFAELQSIEELNSGLSHSSAAGLIDETQNIETSEESPLMRRTVLSPR